MVDQEGIEPSASSMRMRRSTDELLAQNHSHHSIVSSSHRHYKVEKTTFICYYLDVSGRVAQLAAAQRLWPEGRARLCLQDIKSYQLAHSRVLYSIFYPFSGGHWAISSVG